MKKIFKHIFAMFLKTKVIFIGLITLVFFTAAIFTALFTTNRAYVSRLDQYKETSGLQDATISTEFNYFGNAQNNGYDYLEPEIYLPLNTNQEKKQLIINSNYISLSQILGDKTKENEYISSGEFSREFYLNGKLLGKNDSFELTKQAFFPIYITNDKKNFRKKLETYQIRKNEIISLDTKNYKPSDILVFFHQGKEIIISSINPLVINGKTKVATFDPILGASWKKQGIGYELKTQDLLPLLNIYQKENGEFEFAELQNSNSFINFKKGSDGIQMQIRSDQFNLVNNLIWESSSFLILDPGQIYKLEKDWIRNLKTKIEYINHRYKLKEIDSKGQNFSGFIKEYLIYLKANYPKKFKELENINYWEKRIRTIDGSSENVVSSDLSITDLSIPFYKQGDSSLLRTSIAEIQKLNKNNLALVTNEELNNISNSNIKNATFLRLAQNVQEYANLYFYQHLQNYSQKIKGKEEKVVDGIGTRQTFTIDVQQKTENASAKQVIHFINSGISPRIFNKINFQNQDYIQEQQIGRLFQEISDQNNAKKSRLFSQNAKVSSAELGKIPPIFQAKIIANVFDNYGIDPNYVDLKVDFGDVEFKHNKSLNYDYYRNIKIVRLKKIKTNKPDLGFNILPKADLHGIIALPNNQFGYIFKNFGQYHWSLLPENLIKVDTNINPVSSQQRVLSLLANFLENNNFEIDAKIGKDGWTKQVDNYSNIATIPLIFYYFSTNVQNEIETQNSASSLFIQIANAINNSVLVDKNFFLKPDVDLVINAFAKAAEEIRLVDILSYRIKNYNLVIDLITRAGNILLKTNRPTLINDILGNFFDQIIKETENSGKTNYEKSLFFIKQIYALNPALLLGGIRIFDDIQKYASPEALAKAIRDPINLLKGVKKIIYALDFEKFFQYLNNWFSDNKNQNNKNLVNIFTSSDLVDALLGSIDEQMLKSALIEIVNEIDFARIFSAAVDEKTKGFFGFLAKPIIEKFAKNHQNQVIKILEKLNGKQENELAYSNINEGLNELITNFDLKSFKENLIFLRKTPYSYDYDKFLELSDQEKQKEKNNLFAKRSSLSPNDYIIALISTFFRSDSARQKTINSLIKMLNASGKGKSSEASQLGFSYFFPESDPRKIDIYDLQFLAANWNSSSTSPDLGIRNTRIDLVSEEILEKIEQNPNLKISDLNLKQRIFLNKYLKIQNLENLEDIRQKLFQIKEIYRLFRLENYQKTGNQISNIKPPSLESDNIFANTVSIGDIFYYILNAIRIPEKISEDLGPNSLNLKLKPIYILASEAEINKLEKNIIQNPEIITQLVIKTLRFWIRFVSENKLENLDLSKAFHKLFQATKSEWLKNELNNTELLAKIPNLKNQEGLFLGLPKPSRAILQPYLLSLYLEKNPQFQELLADPVFAKSYIDDFNRKTSLKSWLEDNLADLVENLGFISYYSQNYPFEARFDKALKYIMENFLLNPKFSDSAFKKRFLSLLVQEFASINPLLSGLNLESLGLSQFFAAQLVQIPLWFTTNPEAKSEEGQNNFNLAFILQNRLPKISQIVSDSSNKSTEFIKLLVNRRPNKNYIPPFWFNKNVNEVSLDYYRLRSISDFLSEKGKENPEFFGINVAKFYDQFFSKIIVARLANNSINLNNASGYVVKVNKSYLEKNKKEVYQGKIPDSASDIEKLIELLDPKYILNAGGLKYIIVGTDFSIDYLYPVIDEKNVKLDGQNQVLAYVNKFGFDKARFSYQSNPIKNYFLIRLKPGTNREKFRADIDSFIAKNFASNSSQHTFFTNEIDHLNPERALRIQVGTNIIETFSKTNIYLSLFLSILVLFAIAFIIKRYISTNNKVLGILRAQGYSLFEIASSFLSIGFIIAFLGGSLGFLAGFFGKIPLYNLISQFWEFDINIYNFEPISFVFSLIIPFFVISVLIYLVIFWNLRQKPYHLLSGINEINTSKFAQKVAKLFWKSKIVNKFSISLVINSIWKIISLIIAIVIVQFVLIFSLSSYNIFQNSIKKTYQNRHYAYKINLFSPTKEGGPLVVYNAKDLGKNLYVPAGENTEVNYNSPNYFRPGNPSVFGINSKNGLVDSKSRNPVVISRSSLNIKVNQANKASIFDIVLANLPESLRNNIFAISNKVVHQIEKVQNIPEKIKQKQPYFKYLVDSSDPNQGRFWYYQFDQDKNEYRAYEVSIFGQSNNRDAYRKFLVDSYLNNQVSKDFTISFAGIEFSENANENLPKNQVYTYIDSFYGAKNNTESSIKIYGYNPKTEKNSIIEIKDKYNNNLLAEIEKYPIKDEIYPLIINYVFAKKHNLGIGSRIEVPILNHVDRYYNKIKKLPQKKAKFVIIGISDTYINSELITSQAIANKLLGLDQFENILKNYNLSPFNGIILSNPEIEQISKSFSLYSPSGYWAGSSKISVDQLNKDDTIGFFANIFAFSENETDKTKGALQIAGYTKQEILDLINFDKKNQEKPWLNSASALDFASLTNPSFVNQNIPEIKKALKNFNEIYGETIYQIGLTGLEAKNIETNFISNFANLFGAGINIVVIIFLVVSLIILVIIASSIINENQQNIAILDVLGYANKTKVRLFYSIYLPILLISSLISIPFVIIAMEIFNSYILLTNSIFLSLGLSISTFFLAFGIILVVFIFVLSFLWYFLTSKKSVYIIKDKT
ncbi:ABC transporter permease [Mesomycoplasma hyopneumoniae]|uniref:ABC transporter permease n=1 Tax=Mesomycoplasma hyopneumoniae TaxID=2099 RepID=UPI0015CD7F4B|nr:ABC transporter permease [Mesomycoplasma hyopneumoniae]NYN92072.1 FtsX-like permease family protein [Mesomycoplasma hyopneumoniae]